MVNGREVTIEFALTGFGTGLAALDGGAPGSSGAGAPKTAAKPKSK
jgi:hypothetical protein